MDTIQPPNNTRAAVNTHKNNIPTLSRARAPRPELAAKLHLSGAASFLPSFRLLPGSNCPAVLTTVGSSAYWALSSLASAFSGVVETLQQVSFANSLVGITFGLTGQLWGASYSGTTMTPGLLQCTGEWDYGPL